MTTISSTTCRLSRQKNGQTGGRREPGFYDEAPRIEAPSIDIGN